MFSLDKFKQNMTPEVRTALGMGLLSGGDASQQWANGAQALGGAVNNQRQTRQDAAKINKTLDFLKGVNPELAQAVEAGALSAGDAYGQHLRAQTPKTLPSGLQEYEYAKQQGFDGSFMDYKQRLSKASATNVNVNTASKVGTIPQGYQLMEDPQSGTYSMSPISGGPEDMSEKAKKQQAQDGQKATIARQSIADIKRIVDQGGGGIADLPETGIVGGALAKMGINQEAVDVKRKLENLQSIVAFDRLQAMREASPTGGALGAVSERELALLQASMGALQQDMSKGDLIQTLDFIESVMKKFEGYPNYAEPLGANDGSNIQSLVDKYAD